MKTAIVTGGSRGIGRAACVALSKKGFNVIVNYANGEEAANQTVTMCEANGVKAIAVKADVSLAADCEALVKAAQNSFGSVDVLVNNAGITRDNLLARMSEEEFDAVINTNLKGAFLMMRAVTRPMMKQRSGRIVNISSVVGLMGNAGQVNYAASKAGVIGMTKSLARELAARNVTVNAVAPGFIETDMTAVIPQNISEKLIGSIPQARFGKAEDVASAVAFFASEEAAYVTGQVLCVDGGMAMM